MSANANLHKAKDAKNDEFYTQLMDVSKELMHYKQHFKDKIVFCNCDDPTWSAFWKYFHLNGANIKYSLPAALLIFLNKAGFNGLYRVNASEIYNVPPAHWKNVKAYDRDNIMAMAKALKKTKIMCGDFAKSCKNAEAEDFVFFDSPYYGTFDTYQAGGFSEADHIRLFELFKALSDKGVHCMMTNNNCDFIKNLYRDFNIKVVDVKRMINCDGKNRVGKEVIVTNYDAKE